MAGFNTRAIHAAPPASGAVTDISAPIHFSSSYEFSDLESAQKAFRGESNDYVYGRVHNPTQHLLEWKLKELEHAEAAVVTASGIAAISSFFLSNLNTGDEVIAHHCLYGNTYRFLRDVLSDMGVRVRFLDLSDLRTLSSNLSSRTRFAFLELPTNPFLEVLDIEGICTVLEDVGAQCVVDSTLGSPALTQPIDAGAHVVIHSLTKFIGGHGDIIGGAVIGGAEAINRVRKRGLRFANGGTLSPMNAFLAIRGLKTLGLRMSRHSSTARMLVDQLDMHPRVQHVYYPNTSNSCVAKYMPVGGGGVFSFCLNGDIGDVRKFINGLSIAKIAVSLGTCETLVEHPSSMTHAAYSELGSELKHVPENLIRIAVGLEDAEDLATDIILTLDKL